MICQNCGKNEATTHVKQVVNGDTTEKHLCTQCAQHLGYGDIFSGFGLNLDDLFGGFLGDTMQKLTATNEQRCPTCGNTFRDIANSGRLGCSNCYRTFYDKLLPSIQRIHGRIKHSGKQISVPDSISNNNDKESEINNLDALKAQLAQAVENQEYEQAAIIRDKIKEIENDNSK